MRLSFFGYGLTTRAIARRLGGDQTFYDDRTEAPWQDEEGNTILPSSHFDPETSDLEILTPSIRPDHPLLQKARHPISEYDLFLGEGSPYQSDSLPTPFTIWISGTNGKTTTTQMLTHLLASRGAIAGGNIGTPLADLDPSAPIWVLESSSYALHHTHTASPDIYLLLPITPDHLDWHGTAQAYAADKLRPLLNMREGELALVPKGLDLPPTNAWVVEYDSVEFLAEFFDLDPSRLRYRAAFLEDAMLALSVSRTLFDQADYDRLNAFTLDHHRQEEITDVFGRLWVNDSKATNVDATLQALATYADRPIHLILGGDDKGVDLYELMDTIAAMRITIYTVGSNNNRLIQMAAERAIPAHSCHTLAEAIPQINAHLKKDEVALLSPAASSLDQFPSYAKRGEIFMDSVRALRGD
jgi:UDP-N-acetylmuramoylalanine--D-glutamate ligase